MERAPVHREGPVRTIRRTSLMADTVDEILSSLGPAALGIYTYLAQRCNRDGQCWPSYDTIAIDCNVQRRYAIRVMRSLEEHGFVVIERRRDGRGGHDANVFTLPGQRVLFGLPGERGSDRPGDHPSVLPIRKNQRGTAQRNSTEEGLPFDLFYAPYPRKMARADAERAWARLDPEQQQRAIDALPAFIACEQWQDPKYIPYPATWINKGHWQDTPAEAAGGLVTWLLTGEPK